ncbi:MAG: protein-L-isoaspartate(D-aspartate) O-methyltransferase [Verrucomicrobia bacterium]|nr:protein-L-isoaspartate(D-aspartate) O-methyltransferase [Verrucomicrobiota bacterium]
MRRLSLPALLAACLWLGTGCAPEKDRDSTHARKRMVHEQLTGPGRGIKDERVLTAMHTVPRHEFVPDEVRFSAYDDRPLPIGHGQTISQPFIVAFMTEQLKPLPTDKILEVGTGSGYQAAILSGLVKEVFTIEIVEPLAKRAETDLRRLGYTNVLVKAGDGYKGWPEHAPFDAIIVTCAPDQVPKPLIEQLRDGGRMIIPVGPDGGVQELYVLEKRGGEVKQRAVLPVRFVPMTREGGAKP